MNGEIATFKLSSFDEFITTYKANNALEPEALEAFNQFTIALNRFFSLLEEYSNNDQAVFDNISINMHSEEVENYITHDGIALKEEEERTDLSGELIERTADEKGFSAMFQEFIDKAPPEYVNKDLKFSNCFDDFPKKKNKGNKSYKKLPIEKNRSLLVKASYLLNRKIKLEGGFHVKVVCVMMSNDGVFLEVEEKVGDKLEYYEIMYQQDMVGI
ncbi:hypothetical protein C1646_752968 [Rhizophagus diaphanus]|nr:hypothetical protein C1646_752968 [Rhizophagus diaphanus] [Rhizophagus sp. MUCL 43196]